MKTLAIDLETYSELDISKVGVYKYAENCEVMLCAYAYDDEPVKIVDMAMGEKLPFFLVNALMDKRVVKTAYNAAFEINVLTKYLGRQLDASQWQCTMVKGLSLGLPAGLDKIGKVLKMESDKQKLSAGKRLIKYFSMPSGKKKTQGNRNFPKDNAEKWIEFKEYCKQDVEAERAIRKRLEKYEIIGVEKRLWQLDQTINNNGVWIDMELVKGAIEIADFIRAEAMSRSEKITGGLNLNSNAQIKHWIEEQEGFELSSLDKAARSELKGKEITPLVSEILQLKDTVSKASVKKYETMVETACADDRARGMFQFYGASRTGRWSGRHIQLQNLPQRHVFCRGWQMKNGEWKSLKTAVIFIAPVRPKCLKCR